MLYLFVSDVNEKTFGINDWTDYTGVVQSGRASARLVG